MKNYQKLSSLLIASSNCVKNNNNEWHERHEDSINMIMQSSPSGSGIDCGTTLNRIHSNNKTLFFSMSFHHINENGYYTIWTEHNIVIIPSFDGFDIRITGKNHNDIKEYLCDVYSGWLNDDIE